MVDDGTPTLILKPSLLTVGGAVAFCLFATVMASIWLPSLISRGGPDFAGLVLPLGILAFIGYQIVLSLRHRTLVLSPESFSVVTGDTTQTARWSDVQEIRLGRISMQRGRSMGVAVKRQTGPDIKIHDVYATGREEVFEFLAAYARVHAPHVAALKERGFFEFG